MQPIHSQQSMIEKYQMFNIHNLVALKHIIIFIVQLIDTDRIDINPLSGKSGLRIHCKVATDKLIKKSKECKKKYAILLLPDKSFTMFVVPVN